MQLGHHEQPSLFKVDRQTDRQTGDYCEYYRARRVHIGMSVSAMLSSEQRTSTLNRRTIDIDFERSDAEIITTKQHLVGRVRVGLRFKIENARKSPVTVSVSVQ